jgi:glutathione S-transferase
MQFYWWPKARSLRALWMLEEAAQPYERVPVNLQQGGQKDPAFLRVNPRGKLQSLAEAKLAESAAICPYVADVFRAYVYRCRARPAFQRALAIEAAGV